MTKRVPETILTCSMPLPALLPASRIAPASEAPTLRWGILGSGWIAERFIESVRAHTKQDIVAVGSRRKDRAEEFASHMALKRAYGDYNELVAADDLDVIYVATPHNMHHEGSRWGHAGTQRRQARVGGETDRPQSCPGL